MQKPIIGIVGTPFETTPQTKKGFEGQKTGTRTTYEEAITKAGGIPLVLPACKDAKDMEAQLNLVQGLIFQGGGGDKQNEDLQIKYIKAALLKDLPLLGICMGMQLINVACLGKIKKIGNISHLQNTPLYRPWHKINITTDTLLYKMWGPKTKVNSYHKYHINKLGKNLTVEAMSEEGIIEAISLPSKKFVYGVQFHPEHLLKKEERWLELFERLIKSCS